MQQPRDLAPPCEEGSRDVQPAPEIPCPACPTDTGQYHTTEAKLVRMLAEIRSREEAMAIQMRQLEDRLARVQQQEVANQRQAADLGSARAAGYPVYPAAGDNPQVRWAERYPVRPSAHVAPAPIPVPRRLPADVVAPPRRLPPPSTRITGVSNFPQ